MGSLQRVRALLPRAAFICDSDGYCTGANNNMCQEMLARWETFWLSCSSLQPLTCTVHSDGFSQCDEQDGLKLPDGLKGMKLVIDGSEAEDEFEVYTLEARQYHAKVTDLHFAADFLCTHGLHFGVHRWPLLKSLKCTGDGFAGDFNAPNLAVIDLEIGDGHARWQLFESCCNLQKVCVTSSNGTGNFDCVGGSFPCSLVHLYLSVGLLLEDGCFKRDLASLRSMHV